MIRTTLTSKGQLTIPKAVRRQLGLREGDRFKVSVVDDEIRLRPLRRYRAAQLRDLLRGPDFLRRVRAKAGSTRAGSGRARAARLTGALLARHQRTAPARHEESA